MMVGSSPLLFLLSFLFGCLFLGPATSKVVLECVKPYCVDLGGNCSASFAVCRNNGYCGMNDYICTAQVAIGGTCNANYECLNGGTDVMCFNNTCQSVTRNQVAGQSCDQLQQCQQKFMCAYGVCKNYPGLGETCYGMECSPGLACSYDNVCIKSYSVPVGGNCSTLPVNYVSNDCAPGLFCSDSGICVKGFKSSNAACNETVDCSNPHEFCQCNICTAPTTASQKQADAIVKLSNCVVDENCDPQQPEKCCKKYQCAVHSFYSNVYPYKQMESVNCGEDIFKFCSSPLSTGQKIAIIVGVSVGVVIIVVIVVYVVQRRRHHHYSKI